MALVCFQCGVQLPPPTGTSSNLRYRDQWYCSRACKHAAGDRSACLGRNCGCTQYAKKRRLLRDNRIKMRIMEDILVENGLEEELDHRLIEETGNTNCFLGLDAFLDESSDTEDPEHQLRATVNNLRTEAADQSALVSAVHGALEHRDVMLQLERKAMELEDLRSRQL